MCTGIYTNKNRSMDLLLQIIWRFMTMEHRRKENTIGTLWCITLNHEGLIFSACSTVCFALSHPQDKLSPTMSYVVDNIHCNIILRDTCLHIIPVVWGSESLEKTSCTSKIMKDVEKSARLYSHNTHIWHATEIIHISSIHPPLCPSKMYSHKAFPCMTLSSYLYLNDIKQLFEIK